MDKGLGDPRYHPSAARAIIRDWRPWAVGFVLVAVAALPLIFLKPADLCDVDEDLVEFSDRLPRTAKRLAQHRPLRIVAVGSSSTEGVGATVKENAYPERLRAELLHRFPDTDIRVVNRGVGGQLARDMVERFPRHVAALNPHLVIWQTGTNDALHDVPLPEFRRTLAEGLTYLKRRNYDVILMEPQIAYDRELDERYAAYAEIMAAEARLRKIPVFQRQDIMKEWIASRQLGVEEVLRPDQLHMTDRSYACLSRLLAKGIMLAVTEPVAPMPDLLPEGEAIVEPAASESSAPSIPASGASR